MGKNKKIKLTNDEIAKFRQEIERALLYFKRLKFPPLKKVEDDILALAAPRREELSIENQLNELQTRREGLLDLKLTCATYHGRIKKVLTHCLDYLSTRKNIAALKNEALRQVAYRRILGKPYQNLDRLEKCIDHLDALLWSAKDNQSALLAQVELIKVKSWNERS